MRKFTLSAAFFSALLFLFSSCRVNTLTGEGNRTTQSPALAAFSAIDIDVPLKAVINVQEGSQPGIQINSYNNILKHIKTEVANNKLRVYCDLDESLVYRRQGYLHNYYFASIDCLIVERLTRC
jgi:hypothetical protein